MAVIEILEEFNGRGLNEDPEQLSMSRSWKMKTDDPSDDGYTVRQSVPVYMGQPHPSYGDATARSLSVNQMDGSNVWWEATVTYSNRQDYQASEDTDVLDQRAKITFSTVNRAFTSAVDINGKPFVNTANDFFEDPPQLEYTMMVINIQKNVIRVPDWLLSFPNSINSGPINVGGLSFDTKTVLFKQFTVSEQKQQGDTKYYDLRFSLEVNPLTWTEKILNTGHQIIEEDPTDPTIDTKIPAKGGTEFGVVCLTENSEVIESPIDTNGNVDTRLHFIEFEKYALRDFGVLPLT